MIDDAVGHMGHEFFTWRRVPTNNRPLGQSAKATEPVIEQLFISATGHLKLEAEQQVRAMNQAASLHC
jgi:glutamate synthase (NADPH/NADH) large chain